MARAGGVLLLLASLSIAVAAQAPAGAPPAGAEGGRGRVIRAELSELLVHSPMEDCAAPIAVSDGGPGRVRVGTWNIRAARSAPIEQIAAEIGAMQLDVVALQEVDVRVRRTGFVDQPVSLAGALGFHYAFAASIKWDGGDYGLALLSRWPIVEVRRHRIDAADAGEPRIILETVICAGGRPLRVFNHHADGREAPRMLGLAALRQIVGPSLGRGTLVLGDMNDYPGSPGLQALVDDGLVDLGARFGVQTSSGGRIDYLLADTMLAPHFGVARVWPTGRSDHHAVVADLAW
jgi:endonuclease/exonuclease/phosphatase family metal-dependent hydrolase